MTPKERIHYTMDRIVRLSLDLAKPTAGNSAARRYFDGYKSRSRKEPKNA